MHRNALIMTAMACLTVIFVCTTWAPAQGNANNNAETGRYQISAYSYGFLTENGNKVEEKGVWVIDTTSSETWRYTGTAWRSTGSPD